MNNITIEEATYNAIDILNHLNKIYINYAIYLLDYYTSNKPTLIDDYLNDIQYKQYEINLLILKLTSTILKHDLSKLSKEEFDNNCRFRYKSHMGLELSEEERKLMEYNNRLHTTSNRHHPEYWIIDSDNPDKNMPIDNKIELVLDWIAASMCRYPFKISISAWNKFKEKANISDKLFKQIIDITNIVITDKSLYTE